MNNKKGICEFTQPQLHFVSLPTGRGNTLLDYDLVPRFLHDRAQKKVPLSRGAQPPRIINMSESEKYQIIPALIHLPDPSGDTDTVTGKVKMLPYAIYPGTRESLIEDCLVYFARNGEFSREKGRPGYRYEAGNLGVIFTLYQLRAALKAQGKEYKLCELREGLDVLALAKYRYTNDTERDRVRGYIVSEVDSIPNPCPNDRIRSDRIIHVIFDSRASQRIIGGHYRSFDDACALSMKSPIARYLYKQFTHSWQHANNKDEAGSVRSVDQNETILASGCPLLSNSTKRKNNVLKALNELVRFGIIQKVDEETDVLIVKEGRVNVDVRFMVRPTAKFITQQIEGYKRLQETRKVGSILHNLSLENSIKLDYCNDK
jgi:hypothetical protein